jgi:membrane protein required for colicin V production
VAVDLVLFAVLLVFGLLGAYRGALESGVRLLSWIAAYALAVLAATYLGSALAGALGLAPLAGIPLAGTLAFLATQVVFGVAIAMLRRRREGSEPSGADRALGATFGVARGAVAVVLLGWLALLADTLRSEGVAAPVPLPDASGSRVARWSGVVVEAATVEVLGPGEPGARAAAALVARPRESLEALRGVLEHPRFLALQRDSHFWVHVAEGEVEAALARPAARALAADPELRRELAALGLVTPAAADHAIAFERELEGVLRAAGEGIAALRRDPSFEALLRDPEVAALVERRDALGLLAHPGLQSLLRRARAS